MNDKQKEKLIQEAIEAHKQDGAVEKYHKVGTGTYLKDMVYGGIDGIVTTFAVVAGVAGAALDTKIVLILGFANLIADGLSMGVGNYLGTKSENQFQEKERMMEEWEVEHVPEEEKKEIADIYRKKGFTGKDLDRVVEVITSDKKVWVDEMMIGELGMVPGEEDTPWKNGATTFVAFVIAGFLPLVPYVFGMSGGFNMAIVMTAIALFVVGSLRALFTKQHWFIAGLEMLGVGAIAAVVAYGIGDWIEKLL